MTETQPTPEPEPILIIDIEDKVHDAKRLGLTAGRYLTGFFYDWRNGLISTDMIDNELNALSHVVDDLNSVLEDVRKGLDGYRGAPNGNTSKKGVQS